MPEPARGRGPELWIFLWLALFYVLGSGGQVFNPDGTVMGEVTRSLLEGRGTAADPRWIPDGFLSPGTDGRLYGKYGPGLSFAAAPLALLGRALAVAAPSTAVDLFTRPRVLWYPPHDPSAAWHFFALSWVNGIITAAFCALLYRLARRLGYSHRAALWTAGLAALASPLWVYAKEFYAEPLAALGLTGFALSAQDGATNRQGVRRQILWSCLAGLGLGIAVLAKTAHLILAPLALGAFVAVLLKEDRSTGEPRTQGPILAPLLAFLAGLGLCLVLLGLFNWTRFGSPLLTGYEGELDRWSTPVMTGLAGLLISPGHGLLTHWPLVLALAAGIPLAFRRTPVWTLFAWLALVLLLGLYSRWYAWHGGWCWGPRFLIPVLPLLALGAAPFFEGGFVRPWMRAGLLILAALSAWIAVAGSLVPASEFHRYVQEQLAGRPYAEAIWWDWRFFTAWSYPAFHPGLFYLLPQAMKVPSAWWLAGAFGFGLLWLIPLGLRLKPGPRPRAAQGLYWLLPSAALGMLLALPAWNGGPHVTLHVDFEDGALPRGWTAEGPAFAGGPSPGAREGQQILSRYGSWLVNSYLAESPGATGTLRSPGFLLDGDRATFRIGGARDPEGVQVRLWVGDRLAAQTTGPGSPGMAQVTWDLSMVRGQVARLELVDQSRDPAGYLLFDDFRILRDR